MNKRYVIIGGSAAGPKIASKIRRLDQKAEIVIIQKSKSLSMASCGYPYYVGGVFDDPNLLIATPTGVTRDPEFFFKSKGITAYVETEAIKINREKKLIRIKDLKTGKEQDIPYDKLAITTGANPIKPPIEGIELDCIKTLHSLEDAVDLKKMIANEGGKKKAVVVGGGLIGIETCEALQLAGIENTVVEMLDQVLPFLDWDMAKLVENHIKSKGVEVLTKDGVKKFHGKNGCVASVELQSGRILECDMAIVSIGVKPRKKIAEDCGITIGSKGGIQVNRFMQTNDPDVYSAGDCVEVTNLITHEKQLWPMGDAANLQGRVAAQNMVYGNIEEYEGIIGTGICKVFDFTAGSTGLSEKMAAREGYENIIKVTHAAADKPGFMGAKPVILKLLAEKTTGKFLGMQSVGTGDVAKRLTTAAMALHGRMCIAHMVNLDLPYAPPFSPAIDNFITAIHVLENKWHNFMEGISAVELKEKLDNNEKLFILDVRGEGEYKADRLGIGETSIPLGALRS
ncbi:MAG: FAD-dependent oxidoreductase, partial [Spirochaetaceae bacterium]|nr:FAD-dependent oxidoreductase [Spirochaetaceae bacterium]